MYAYLSAPLTIQWELTEWCNNRCLHCYNEWRHTDGWVEKPAETVADGVYESIAKAIVSAGIFHVTLTGGEPLGALKKAYPYLRHAYESGVHFSINTNLTIMSEELGLLMRNLGIKSVLTSLISHDSRLHNGFTRNPQSFAKTLTGAIIGLYSATTCTAFGVLCTGIASVGDQRPISPATHTCPSVCYTFHCVSVDDWCVGAGS